MPHALKSAYQEVELPVHHRNIARAGRQSEPTTLSSHLMINSTALYKQHGTFIQVPSLNHIPDEAYEKDASKDDTRPIEVTRSYW